MKKISMSEGIAYEAKGHFDMRAMKLHSNTISNCENFSMGVSVFLPGGGTEYIEPPVEAIYFMLEGEMTVFDKDGEEFCTLQKNDSIHFAVKEGRSILNKTNTPATMLVVTSTLPVSN